jgi:hypothetical protein
VRPVPVESKAKDGIADLPASGVVSAGAACHAGGRRFESVDSLTDLALDNFVFPDGYRVELIERG